MTPPESGSEEGGRDGGPVGRSGPSDVVVGVDGGGSGYWLGREALRAVTRAADGRGEATLLTSLVLEKLHLPDAQALVPWSASATKGQVAALAPLVIRARSRDDGVAVGMVERGVDELRRYLEVVAGHWAPWGGVFPLAMVGGLVEEGGPLRDLAVEAVAEVGGRFRKEPVDPARGAALLALELVSFP